MTFVALDNFTPSLGCLLTPALERLATRLSGIATLAARERDAVLAQTRESLYSFLHGKLARVLLLELNAARVTGRLARPDSAQRWAEFLELSSQKQFWEDLSAHYPPLLPRIETIIRNRCAASFDLAQRWAADRARLDALCGAPAGELVELRFGAGDSHRGGLTVAVVRCEGGSLVYKPRSMAIDRVLQDFIAHLESAHGSPLSIRIPKVLDCGEYGWSEFVAHRYADGEDELRTFYRGIGNLIAVMHLLGASDLHAENLIACGPTPVVVDCETLFTPRIPMPKSGLGEALDRASALIAGTVLNIGLLPGRGQALGWRGVDNSGIGGLAGEQPMFAQPAILKAGTDEAYLGSTLVPVPIAQNHPSPEPALALYWPDAIAAFDTLNHTLQRLDAQGDLEARLQAFADCRVRVVLRPTESYAELARMLWHPVSLHDEADARERARDLLAKMAGNAPSAPSDPAVIAAEIEELVDGDIPFFSTRVRDGRLEGPRGTHWLPPKNLMQAALRNWRASDFEFDRNVIRAAMVSAYLNDGWTYVTSLLPNETRTDDLDARRRAQAARLVRALVKNAIVGKDESVAWIAPVLNPAGWSVLPLSVDLYAGLSGIALTSGAYVHEMHAGRADPVDGIEELHAAVRHTLRLAELKVTTNHRNKVNIRPPSVGAYIGLGSQIWTLLALARWSGGHDEEIERALALTNVLRDAVAADEVGDLLTGRAGAIAPLLALFERTQDESLLRLACDLGDAVCERAQARDGRAHWVHETMWPNGVGGFSHGVTGIGWALTKLARVSGERRYAAMAEAAFAFEDSLYDADEANWLDLRLLRGTKSVGAWCHGSGGIGLAHLDLDPQLQAPRTRPLLQRAAAATLRLGVGWNHCLCHGDLGAWELLHKAIDHGEAPEGLTHERLLGQLLSSIEEFGPTCGLTREVYVPGLLPGVGGVAYQLLRAHPDSRLPSVLTLETL
ncbi:MAG TPA: type 2 lanthipeptide synthetase LanM family protein [Rudaea sp.]